MKFFIAQICTETNTYAASLTGWSGFETYGLFRGDGTLKQPEGIALYLAEFRRQAEAEGHTVVESVCAMAQPGGITLKSVYETMRDQVMEDLQAALPVDGVLFFLHGAMVAQGYDDCEGDILARTRKIVGPDVAVGAELDLHCHFTDLMNDSADAIICFKEYPHVDGLERAQELYRIIADTAAGKVRPTTGVYDCRMNSVWHTPEEPTASFVKRMQDLEGRDGVLSVSFGHGFPWGDVAEAGAKVWVITDKDAHKAADLAAGLGRDIWEMREAARPPHMSVDAALDAALVIDGGPVVMGDVADNPGGGSPGDSTFILRRLIERNIGNYAIGAFWDLGAVHTAIEAGVGTTLPMRIGGKCGVTSGDPVDMVVTVRQIIPAHSQEVWGMVEPLGPSVWVQTQDGGDLLLISNRAQIFGPRVFTDFGIDLAAKKLVIVKSTQHFQGEFAPIARKILYVSTPGALNTDFANIPYEKRDGNFWPRVDNPFA